VHPYCHIQMLPQPPPRGDTQHQEIIKTNQASLPDNLR
jgi:hypothetical protein